MEIGGAPSDARLMIAQARAANFRVLSSVIDESIERAAEARRAAQAQREERRAQEARAERSAEIERLEREAAQAVAEAHRARLDEQAARSEARKEAINAAAGGGRFDLTA